VAQAAGQRTSREPANDKAAAAFADFVALGDGRSLSKLAEVYRNRTEPVPTRQLSRLKIWSSKYNWIARIEQFEDEQAESKLAQAARLDADTYVRTSKELNRRASHVDALHMDELIRMRESVRKPQPKGGTAVSVKVSVEVRQLAEQMAEQLGISADELIADAEEVARVAWEQGAAR
jgi:hypothetical protein